MLTLLSAQEIESVRIENKKVGDDIMLRKALYQIAQCPFPLHDYVDNDVWVFACDFVDSENKKRDSEKEI